MKNIIIEVPRNGAFVQLVLRAGAISGQAVIVASDDVEIRLTEPVLLPVESLKPPLSLNNTKPINSKAAACDLDTIFKRLAKLKPAKRPAAINAIKAMFQLTTPISDEAANKILEDIRRQGNLTIGADGKLNIRNAS